MAKLYEVTEILAKNINFAGRGVQVHNTSVDYLRTFKDVPTMVEYLDSLSDKGDEFTMIVPTTDKTIIHFTYKDDELIFAMSVEHWANMSEKTNIVIKCVKAIVDFETQILL